MAEAQRVVGRAGGFSFGREVNTDSGLKTGSQGRLVGGSRLSAG